MEVDVLGDVGEWFRSRSDAVQKRVKDYGNDLASEYATTYNGGHVAGARSGGPSEEINTVTMLEEVNQYLVDSQLESYKMFEEDIAANPENFRNLVVEFKYPEPAGPEFTPADKVPTKFIAAWNDASGKSMRRRFENVPAGKGGQWCR